MLSCHDMRKGQVYTCEDCGLELKVVKECDEAGTPAEDCACHTDKSTCAFSCCGQELTLKK